MLNLTFIYLFTSEYLRTSRVKTTPEGDINGHTHTEVLPKEGIIQNNLNVSSHPAVEHLRQDWPHSPTSGLINTMYIISRYPTPQLATISCSTYH